MLNANYLLARLREGRAGKYLPVAFDRRCMHEFVLSGSAGEARARRQDARHRQAPARLRLPPADRLLPAARRRGADGRADRDRDPETLDAFADAIEAILAEAEEDPEIARERALHDPGPPPRRGRRPAASPVVRQPLWLRPAGGALSRVELAESGSSCLSSSTGANRSPCSSTRSSTSAASKRSVVRVAVARRSRSTSSQCERGRGGRPLARPQRVDGDRRLLLVFWLQSTKTLPLRSAFVICETTRSGSALSSSWATALAKGFVVS